MQKFKQGFLPTSFNQTWSDNRVRRGDQFEISLRNENLFNIPFARLTSSFKLPLVNLPRTWEDFKNENVKIIRNKIEFNHKLKEHLLDELREVISCNRLFCPACLQHAYRNNTFIINLLKFIIVKICTLFQFQCQLAFWVSIIKITLFTFFASNMSSYNNLNFPVARKRRINTVQTLRNVTRKPVPFRLLLISSPCVCKKPQKTKKF